MQTRQRIERRGEKKRREAKVMKVIIDPKSNNEEV
jgi:hypothetical protein